MFRNFVTDKQFDCSFFKIYSFMKAIILLLILSAPLFLDAQISLNEWRTISPVTDSSHNNRNACLQGTGYTHLVFWDQETSTTSSRICYKDLNDPSATQQVVIEQEGIQFTHPKIIELDQMDGSKYFVLLFQTNEGFDIDLKYIIFQPDGTITQPAILSAMPGDDINLCTNQFMVAWENNGKIYISQFQPLSNDFTEPFVVESNDAYYPSFSGYGLNYLVPGTDSTELVAKEIYYSQGSWVTYQTVSESFEGQCSMANSRANWMGYGLTCVQQDIPGSPSGIILTDPTFNEQEYIRSPQFNLTQPAIYDYVIAVKNLATPYFLAFVSDSLVQQEIFVSNSQLFSSTNISQWPGDDRNPQFFESSPESYMIRVHLFWESEREGHSTIYRTYLDYMFGGLVETSKFENLLFSPCPFTNETTIRFQVSGENGETKIRILDLQRREVKTLIAEKESDGWQKAVWDGTNNKGSAVSSGSYLVISSSGGKPQSRIIIKQ